jgi:hypothetical protein
MKTGGGLQTNTGQQLQNGPLLQQQRQGQQYKPPDLPAQQLQPVSLPGWLEEAIWDMDDALFDQIVRCKYNVAFLFMSCDLSKKRAKTQCYPAIDQEHGRLVDS